MLVGGYPRRLVRQRGQGLVQHRQAWAPEQHTRQLQALLLLQRQQLLEEENPFGLRQPWLGASREDRIRVPVLLFVYFSRGTLAQIG